VNPRLLSPRRPEGHRDLLADRDAWSGRARKGARPQGLHALRAGPQGQARFLARGGWRMAVAASPGRTEEGDLPAPSGAREIGGCARGLFWLQKSTSGARSTPSGMGLAPTPYARKGNLPARFCVSRGAFASCKGVNKRRGLLETAMRVGARKRTGTWGRRGARGERSHACGRVPAGTGGSDVVRKGRPPHEAKAGGPRKRPQGAWREISATEGALVRRKPTSLTRRR